MALRADQSAAGWGDIVLYYFSGDCVGIYADTWGGGMALFTANTTSVKTYSTAKFT